MTRFLYLLVPMFLCALHTPAFAEESDTLHMDVDAALLFLDEFQNDWFKVSPPKNPAGSLNGYRTLGIRHLKIDMSWIASESTRFEAQLRPDLFGQDETSRPQDTVSGEPFYRDQAREKALNTYNISLLGPRQTYLGLGVWEDTVLPARVYPAIYSFALAVPAPKYVLGVRGTTLFHQGTAPQASAADPWSIQLIGMVFQDDPSRGEKLGYDEHTFDHGPEVEQPRTGGTMGCQWNINTSTSLGGLIGFNSRRESPGERFDHLGQLVFYKDKLLFSRLRTGLDLRYLEQSWADYPEKRPALRLASALLTTATQVWTGWDVLLGIGAGQQEKHSSAKTEALQMKGYQFEWGATYLVSKNLSATVLSTFELRTKETDAGDTVGGFSPRTDPLKADATDDTQNKRKLQRFALQINYLQGRGW